MVTIGNVSLVSSGLSETIGFYTGLMMSVNNNSYRASRTTNAENDLYN